GRVGQRLGSERGRSEWSEPAQGEKANQGSRAHGEGSPGRGHGRSRALERPAHSSAPEGRCNAAGVTLEGFDGSVPRRQRFVQKIERRFGTTAAAPSGRRGGSRRTACRYSRRSRGSL